MTSERSFPNFKPTMDVSGCEPPVGSDDEESFVVLESSPSMAENFSLESTSNEVLPAFRTNKVREMQTLLKMEISEINEAKMLPDPPAAVSTVEAVTSAVSKVTISPDASYEEIQKHVEELIKENEALKITITQNNISMKNQHSRFVSYKDEVVNVMKTYKEKFNEAKNLIDKFKEENAKLASELEVYINIKKLQEEEIISFKEKIQQQQNSVTNNDRPGDEVTRELQATLSLVHRKLAVQNVENENLKLEIQNLKTSNEDLQNKLQVTSHSVQALNVEKQNLITKINNLRKYETEILSYQQNIEKLTDRSVNASKLEEQLQTKEQEVNVLQFDISALKNEVAKLKTVNAALEVQLNNVSSQSKEMIQSANLKESEIYDLRQDLEKSRVAENVHLGKIAELQARLKEMRDKLNPTLEEDYKQVRQQLSIAQQTITALETEQEKRVEEIEKLRKLIQESENDENFALKEQLTLYKNDFEAEKESKAVLKREKDQIAEDLQNVQNRNKQLQNEVETLRARIQPRSEGYECPKCTFVFSSYPALENHVHRCLELDEAP